MKTGVQVTFDDLAHMLRSLAHDLADEAEADYLRERRTGKHLDGGAESASETLNQGESHDGTGR